VAEAEAHLTVPEDRALALVGLTKRYRETTAVDGVSLAVAPGEVVALLGPSGSGKSTIFRCISRLTAADAGEIWVLGTRMDDLQGAALRAQRRAIGLIFQQFNLIGRVSAIDNVLAGRLGSVGMIRATLRAFAYADRQLALAALDRVGMLDKAYQRADSLSGGQQQRVAIARVVAQQSRIILADEPVASLDPTAADNVLTLLRSIARERGIGVLCSLHQTDLARRYADRIVALKRGRVVLDTTAAAIGADELARIYHVVEGTPAVQTMAVAEVSRRRA
jgi:phosphonate transport system ATP-binding protein